jgi:RNA polymerase sigma-70 factor (sigma-E family)
MTGLAGERAPTRTLARKELRMTAQTHQVDIDALYRTHRLTMVRLACLLVDDLSSAEVVVQAAFFGMWRNQRTLRSSDAAVGYLRRAVVNESRSALRRRRTVRLHLKAAEPDEAEPADAQVLRNEDHREVLEQVRRLPPRQREVLVLRYWSSLSEAEIAETLGITPGTVKSQASRALARLQDTMGALR